LQAAEKVFALHGLTGATTEQIAREANLPKSNVHYYFKTKTNLYRIVLKDILDHWMQAAATLNANDDPEPALRTYVEAKMRLSRDRPYGSRVWAREIMSGAPVIEQFLATELKAWIKARERGIRGWIRAGKIRACDPETVLYMIWATTQHYADFDRQIAIINGGKRLSDHQYRQRTQFVAELILSSVGLNPPSKTKAQA